MGRYHFPSVGADALHFLTVERSVYGIGLETPSLDTGNHRPATLVCHPADVYVLKNLRNLRRVPYTGAHAVVMPMKVRGASGAPTRVVAVFR